MGKHRFRFRLSGAVLTSGDTNLVGNWGCSCGKEGGTVPLGLGRGRPADFDRAVGRLRQAHRHHFDALLDAGVVFVYMTPCGDDDA